ncbi:MAG TPA: winged helix-turn-helix transcriptional regulator [Gaiellaceae bacterium]|nr:winged helix-turn-helix transcriptional regulator [Gaiellaceae bacterium]
MSTSYDGGDQRSWTFLTNHAHTLICIAHDPGTRIQDIATRVGITLRTAQTIVADLVAEGDVTRTRVGRRNQYEVHPELPLRHPLEQDHPVGQLLVALGASAEARGAGVRPHRNSSP